MKRLAIALALLGLAVSSCGSDASENTLPVVEGDLSATSGLAPAAGTCLPGDDDCQDTGSSVGAAALPDAVALGDPNDPDAPLQINFGGFFYSDGTTSQLCSALEESFPPRCGSAVVDIEAPLDLVLSHVAEAFGNPDEAKINIDQGIYWTDDWVNLSGTLQANRLVLE